MILMFGFSKVKIISRYSLQHFDANFICNYTLLNLFSHAAVVSCLNLLITFSSTQLNKTLGLLKLNKIALFVPNSLFSLLNICIAHCFQA
jgi:hypothetical protein